MITDPIAVLAVLTAIVFISVQLELRFKAARALGAALVGILLAMVVANLGLITGDSRHPTYEALGGIGTNLAIACILLGVDLRSIRQAGPLMLAAFAIGAVGTALGATTAALLLQNAIGPETPKLAAQFTGTYTGGGMNFAALGAALETDRDLFNAAQASDVVLTAFWMLACLAVPVLLGRKPRRTEEPLSPGDAPMTLERQFRESGKSVSVLDLAAITAIALIAYRLSTAIEAAAKETGTWLGQIPAVLWITTMILVLAQIPAVKRLTGSAVLGNYILLVFLASNGAQSVIANIVEIGPETFYFAAVTVGVHGLIVFGVGSLFRIDLATLAVASQANVGGAASAVALASARGYSDRLLPGVAVGLLGYAVGTYSGWGIYKLLGGLPT